MTEVYISAVSTTRIDLNEEDRQFYRDEKLKEIHEVRSCLNYLHLFGQSTPKERLHLDLPLVWKAITFLAKILGYETEFLQINKLRLPENILLQDIFSTKEIFVQKAYRSMQVIDRWDSESDKYIILLSGVVEREVFRSSIFEASLQQLISKAEGIYKSRKNPKKKFMRNDEQIPICINSKRSQLRAIQVSSGLYRSLTCSETFEVHMPAWKKYVSCFRKIEEHFIQGFIKRSLNIDLGQDVGVTNSNQDLSATQKEEKDQSNPAGLYVIENYPPKSTIQLDNRSIFLLFQGEMLVRSPFYHIFMTPGCILNSQIYQELENHTTNYQVCATAWAQTETIVIKINIYKLVAYQQERYQQESLLQLLKNLEQGRKSQGDASNLNKAFDSSFCKSSNKHYPEGQSPKKDISQKLRQYLRSSVNKGVTISPKRHLMLHNCKGSLKKHGDDLLNKKSQTRLLPWMQIENCIEKKEQVVQFKKREYSNKIRKTEPSKMTRSELEDYEQYNILNAVLLKDSMMHIQAKNECLKKTILQRKNKEQETNSTQTSFIQPVKYKERIFRNTSTDILKRKIKQMYLKTEEDREDYLPHLQNVSERYQRHLACREKKAKKGRFQTENDYPTEEIWTHFGEYMPRGRGVMKMQKGQLRRVKVR